MLPSSYTYKLFSNTYMPIHIYLPTYLSSTYLLPTYLPLTHTLPTCYIPINIPPTSLLIKYLIFIIYVFM
jgi:hypothetical protein